MVLLVNAKTVPSVFRYNQIFRENKELKKLLLVPLWHLQTLDPDPLRGVLRWEDKYILEAKQRFLQCVIRCTLYCHTNLSFIFSKLITFYAVFIHNN